MGLGTLSPKIKLTPRREVAEGVKKTQVILSVVFALCVIIAIVLTMVGMLGNKPSVKVTREAQELIDAGEDLADFNCKCGNSRIKYGTFLTMNSTAAQEQCSSFSSGVESISCSNVVLTLGTEIDRRSLWVTSVLSEDTLNNLMYDLVEGTAFAAQIQDVASSSLISGVLYEVSGSSDQLALVTGETPETLRTAVDDYVDAILDMEILEYDGDLNTVSLVDSLAETSLSYVLEDFYSQCQPHSCYELQVQPGWVGFLNVAGVVAGQVVMLKVAFVVILEIFNEKKKMDLSKVGSAKNDNEMENLRGDEVKPIVV